MKNKKLTSILLDLGLTENEANVYLAAISTGPATVMKISQVAEMKRTTVYSIIEVLKQKGLMLIEIKGWKKLYVAESPEKLKSVLNAKKQRLQDNMPEFLALYNLKGNESLIKYYEGIKAIETVYENLLKELKSKDYYYVLSNTKAWIGLDPDFFENFMKKRSRLNLDLRLLLQQLEIVEEYRNQAGGNIKFLPKKTGITSSLTIVPNKIIIHQLTPPVMAIVIESPSIIEMNKKMFEIMWEAVR